MIGKAKRKMKTLKGFLKEGRYDKVFRHGYRNLMRPLINRGYRFRDQFSVLEEEWDTLIILDACRYDTFEAESDLQGSLDSRYSRASRTYEWLARTFIEDEYDDIVYISANPHTQNAIDGEEIFHDVRNVFQTHWYDEYGTVMPDAVSKAAKELREEYPEKRLVIHYIQPHAPYIGEKKVYTGDLDPDKWRPTLMDELAYGGGDPEGFYKAYRYNLLEALESVEKLLPSLQGDQVVISSDHGELFGEKKFYGHPADLAVEELVQVPWFEVDMEVYEGQEEIFNNVSKGDDAEIKEKLEALGYGSK
jgi:hypothetical protein